ncbi:MAG: hypothetical protein AAF745_07060 [Planctomycetota bacterium]
MSQHESQLDLWQLKSFLKKSLTGVQRGAASQQTGSQPHIGSQTGSHPQTGSQTGSQPQTGSQTGASQHER